MAAEIILLRRDKATIDTSAYISYFYHGHHDEEMTNLLKTSVPWLHSTVFEELLAGARSGREFRDLYRYKEPFVRSERLITPTDNDWTETGHIINQLIKKIGGPSAKSVSLTHDVLLAVSARRLGIRVITENKKDFEKIRFLKDFKLTVWS